MINSKRKKGEKTWINKPKKEKEEARTMHALFILAYDSMTVTAHVTSEHFLKKIKKIKQFKKPKNLCSFAQIMGEQDQKKKKK